MIDWKYGFYHLFWWTGFIISISLVAYLIKASWLVSTVLILAVALAIMGILSIFEKRHPYLQEKKRQTTIKHFRLFHSTVLAAIFILLFGFISDHPLVLIYFVALADIVPSFFTKMV
ncbi:hypothetical protein TEHN7128_1516 [Tetragenococcus halophilus subsp. halophilus]|uniref:Uncharacterized protein n=2 Tax=Tetragenococcus halophilus TaxID=51669 RepID=A0A2H6CT03_TETHA|nr:hypothetical protein [Tetragenococcus halophilus]MCO8285289.1 hypothetical protein [Tetragenococcus halophilus]MCO8297980.1 hypothetical protein [Tetragenococcus halophilus]GBD66870.1 hypothetical protein TEHN7116_1834 [Tetragenococcus halophilus subsp. halophilus]GBD68094.1 hypothetical protein TEHN7118_0900 [Tetragenococcus halophilus subsp. halophilus]GBD78287.1 hypothetical protein TEHN7128_1516 [Tetragenococcus halophilus subsp. halophilus]